jgi:hypothetical protein
MKFCPVVPEICHGQVHVPKKERRKRKRRIIIIIITRYDYNLTIMKFPNRPLTTGLKNKLKATFEIEQC